MLAPARAETLSYSAVKLFSKYSNLCEKHTSTSRTDRLTDGRTTYRGITALCVATRGNNMRISLMVVGVCSGWFCYSSQCYYVSSDEVEHSTANASCHSQNADLVSIINSTENNFITSIRSVLIDLTCFSSFTV